MANVSQRVFNKAYLWVQKKAEVARFQGIILADCRRRSPHFQTTLLGSLQFVRDHDPARFARIQRHIAWIVNSGLELGRSAEYNAETRTCSIDFQEPQNEQDESWHQIWYVARHAMTLVHEATHGLLISRGIAYTPEFRARIEKVCVAEENRFLRRVEVQAQARSQSELAIIVNCLRREFNPSDWEPAWTASRLQRAYSLLQQLRSE